VESIDICLWNEAAVRNEVGCQKRYASLASKQNQARVHMLVRKALHELVMANRMRRDVDSLGNAWRGQAGFFNAGYGFHMPDRITPLRLAQQPVTLRNTTVRYD
jgi:hypothetical protein